MPPARDLYEVLGLGRGASEDDIRRAYRKLAREHHPDVNADPAAEERFKEVAGAYEILSDPEKRQRYDTFGQAGGPQMGGFEDIQDIFDLFFGGGGFGGVATGRRSRGPRTRVRRGEDLAIGVTLTFDEAAAGVRRDLAFERYEACQRCDGVGAEPPATPVTCRTCGGMGEIQSTRRSIFGAVMTSSPCRACDGSGSEILEPCQGCSGRGRVLATAEVPTDIPAGVDDGMELRIEGNGNAGVAGGPAGYLAVQIRVEPSPVFERRDRDLFCMLEVSATQAVLGALIEIEGVEGPERVQIEAGTDAGTVLRLKGKGLPSPRRRGRGDLYVTVHVATPTGIDRQERKLWEQLAQLRGEHVAKREAVTGKVSRPRP
jgi:molecular chaperone DnaJ